MNNYHLFIRNMLKKLSKSSTGLHSKDNMKEAVKAWRDFKSKLIKPEEMDDMIEMFTNDYVNAIVDSSSKTIFIENE